MINKIHCDDCLNAMKKLERNTADLAVLDPPYNIGADKWDKIENYFSWMKEVLFETIRILKPNGSLYLWGTSQNNDFLKLKIFLDENQNELFFRNWIVWVHDVKIHKKLSNKFLTKHEDLLFYSGNNATFNQVRDNPPDLQLKIFDGRYDENFFVKKENLPPSQQKIFKNGLQLGSPAKSWWKGPANKSNGKTIKHAGYKSEWVCERIILSSSNKGDLVLVPFCGSGTECLVAKRLGRRFIGIEKEKEYFLMANERLKNETRI